MPAGPPNQVPGRNQREATAIEEESHHDESQTESPSLPENPCFHLTSTLLMSHGENRTGGVGNNPMGCGTPEMRCRADALSGVANAEHD
jgi:hypothetical protein